MTDLVEVSKVLTTRGLKGELKVKPFPCGIPKVIYIDDVEYKVEHQSALNAASYVRLSGINCVESAIKLRGLTIKIARKDLNLADDEILSSELIGFEVFYENGKQVGVVSDIVNYGAGDIVVCGGIMIPYEDDFIIETNITKKTLVVRLFDDN